MIFDVLSIEPVDCSFFLPPPLRSSFLKLIFYPKLQTRCRHRHVSAAALCATVARQINSKKLWVWMLVIPPLRRSSCCRVDKSAVGFSHKHTTWAAARRLPNWTWWLKKKKVNKPGREKNKNPFCSPLPPLPSSLHPLLGCVVGLSMLYVCTSAAQRSSQADWHIIVCNWFIFIVFKHVFFLSMGTLYQMFYLEVGVGVGEGCAWWMNEWTRRNVY